LTLISSVPNIIVGTVAEISFVTFFIKSAPFVLVATVITLLMGSMLFKIKRLTTSVLPGISSLGMGYVAMSFAVIMLWRYKSEVNKFYSAVDWDLLGFFAALFVVIYVMEHAMVLHAIGNGLQMVLQDFKASPANQTVMVVGDLWSKPRW